MKLVLYLFLAVIPPQDSLKLMFWNVENFFDYHNEGANDSDAEFSSRGPRHWTKKRFKTKCNAVAKTILAAADRYGALPDVVGLAEIENAFVLRRLLEETALRKTDYAYAHFDSPDPRGIDVALLWRKSRLELIEARPYGIEGLATRDILGACFKDAQGEGVAVFICHLPSKYSGAESEGRRAKAVSRLMQVSDSLWTAGWTRQTVAGDFNDVVSSGTFSPLNRRFRNLSEGLTPGTIRFSGVWETIDQAWASEGFAAVSFADVCDFPFLTTKDKSYGGVKPLRTYTGPAYQGGVSDHYPIFLVLIL